MVMGLIQVSLLVLGAVMLADAALPHSVKWLNPRSPWSPGTYYSQNQVQAFSPYDSSMTPWDYGRIEPNSVLNMPQPPVTFYPRGFREESAGNPGQKPGQTPGQKPEQNPVQDRVQHPAEHNVQTPGRHPAQDPVSASPQLPSLVSGSNPPAWNLVQTPVPAPVWKPVLAPVQESAPSPLPEPVQAPAEKSSQNNVPVWNPVQSPLPVPPQNVPLLSGPSTGLGPAHVPVPVPPQNFPLPSGPSSVLLPAQDPGPAFVPVPFQSLPQLSDPSTGSGPAYDPSLVPMPAQNPQLPSGPSTVLLPVQDPYPASVPFQSLPQLSDPSTGSGPAYDPSLVPMPAQNPQLPSGPSTVLLPAQDPGPAFVPVPFQSLPQLSDPSTGSGPAYDPSLVPMPAQNPQLPSGPSTVLLPVQDPYPASVPFQSLPQLSDPSTGSGPAYDPSLVPMPAQNPQLPSGPSTGPASGMSPDLTSSPSDVLLTSPQASLWSLGPTSAQSPGLSSAQAPNPTLYPDPLNSLQLQVHLPTEPLKKLLWRFPKAPERPKQFPVQFSLRQPTPVNSVAAACGESMVHVEVKQDFFGNGMLVNPSSLTLGGCAASGLDSAARVLIFNSELQACGSVLTMTEDYLIYSFHLLYRSEPLFGTSIVRTGRVNVQIDCHYSRKHNVSSIAVSPTWVPYSSTVAAEEHLVFTMKLMTDDWQYERPSNQYFLGEFMKIEASLTQFNHVPLRVFVDHCVATAVPDINAVPRYTFIENHGCLVDAKITGSNSEFMKRVQDDKLQFQLEVFRFEQTNSSMLYITCFLKASTTLRKTDAEHKACSFETNGWAAADGNDQDCNCCDGECVSRKGRSVHTEEDQYFETEVSLGPILVEDDDHLLQ
ncbi:lysine-specific demethylase 6B-like isoform X1 [Astyanax mexicanus]|uniref:lysine-specific demethylase 6B-like isoform X1 n=1 Tax=Astyanax mexicanus TaxID=7994 RepID=UPI0020CB41B7|nr:lysine-specific demethylase 6B-like isoform X1 [Astyanax mexicanus]